MIDFRYHLVSLAAVLIALSVGIVLGAGPLNDGIGNTLSSEVTRLRGEKEDLRSQLGDAERGNQARDGYGEATLERVVAGQLDGRRVSVLTLPGAAAGEVEQLGRTLDDAGAEVGDPIPLDPSWVSADGAAERTDAGGQALTELGLRADGDQDAADTALTALLTGRQPTGGGTVRDDDRARAWQVLSDADLLTGDLPDPAELVLVVGAPRPSGDDGAATTAEMRAWVRLAAALDQRAGVVLAASGSTDDPAATVSPVTVARTDGGLADGISTVDDPKLPMGRAVVVLALREQLDGDSGHYGVASDAAAPAPEL